MMKGKLRTYKSYTILAPILYVHAITTGAMTLTSTDGNCDSCGAPAKGLICGHCGRPAARLADASEENRALEEFHNLLQRLGPEEQRGWLLTSGFLPDHKEVLIEAGVHCIPLLQHTRVYDAAASRLEAVISKLKLLHGDRQAALAVEDFLAQLEKYRAARRRDDLLGAGCLLLILAAVAGVGWWMVWGFGWYVAVPATVVIIVTVAWLILKK